MSSQQTVTPSVAEHLHRAAGTVAFQRPDARTSELTRDWVRGFAGVQPDMPDVKIRRELEMQTRTTLEEQFSEVYLCGVSVDYVTDPQGNRPGWTGTHDLPYGSVSLEYHASDPAVILSVEGDSLEKIRDAFWSDASEADSIGAWDQLLEPVVCNTGLRQLQPRQAGLTSNPFVLTDEVDFTATGDIRNVGRLIYFEPYQTRCPLQTIAVEKLVRLAIKP